MAERSEIRLKTAAGKVDLVQGVVIYFNLQIEMYDHISLVGFSAGKG